jgi:hypothetical protein
MLNITSPSISPSPGDPDCFVLGPVGWSDYLLFGVRGHFQLRYRRKDACSAAKALQLHTALIVTDEVSIRGKSYDLSPHVLFNFDSTGGDRLQRRDAKSVVC